MRLAGAYCLIRRIERFLVGPIGTVYVLLNSFFYKFLGKFKFQSIIYIFKNYFAIGFQ